MSFSNWVVRWCGIAFLVGGMWTCIARPSTAADQQGQPAAPVAQVDDGNVFGLPVCSPPGRFWIRADYMSWWTSGMRLPALVTTSPQGTPHSAAGVLPGATVLYGNQTVGNDLRSGFRTTLGTWLGPCHVWGVEWDYFALPGRANDFSRTSTGDPILARPFFDVQAPAQASEVVAYPNQVEGTIAVNSKDYFQSGGVLLTYDLCSNNKCGGICEVRIVRSMQPALDVWHSH